MPFSLELNLYLQLVIHLILTYVFTVYEYGLRDDPQASKSITFS